MDKRADVWAFGAVLFEMLTGRRCFHGDDVSEVFAAILRQTPEWTSLPASIPPAVTRMFRRCLERDVRSRLSDMAMVRVELREAEMEPPIAAAVAAPPKPSAARRLASYGAVILAAVVAGAIVWRVRQPVDEPRPLARFSIALPDQVQLTPAARTPVAISPDGTHLVLRKDSER